MEGIPILPTHSLLLFLENPKNISVFTENMHNKLSCGARLSVHLVFVLILFCQSSIALTQSNNPNVHTKKLKLMLELTNKYLKLYYSRKKYSQEETWLQKVKLKKETLR